jgi:hypothetical protein
MPSPLTNLFIERVQFSDGNHFAVKEIIEHVHLSQQQCSRVNPVLGLAETTSDLNCPYKWPVGA